MSESHTPSGWYVEDVTIEKAQPSNGDPRWHVKTRVQMTILGGQDAVTQGKGVKGFHWCI